MFIGQINFYYRCSESSGRREEKQLHKYYQGQASKRIASSLLCVSPHNVLKYSNDYAISSAFFTLA
jgi:hypothetical protein